MPSIDTIIALIDSFSDNGEAILDSVLAAFDCPTGTLHRLDTKTNLLHLQAQRGIPEKLLPIVSVIPVGKGMAGICAERREPVQTCNLQTDSTGVIRPGAKETRMEGAISVPILLDNKLLGTFGVAKPIAYDFSAAETEALERVAQALAHQWSN